MRPSRREWRRRKRGCDDRAGPQGFGRPQSCRDGIPSDPGGNARSQSVVARYAYTFDGKSYTGSRVSLYAPDNLGTFHHDACRELNDYLTRKAPYPLHVNPRAPDESILMPILRWEAIGFCLILIVVFGGVGWTVLVTTLLAVRQRRAEAERVERYPDEPWKQRVEWAGPCIRSEQPEFSRSREFHRPEPSGGAEAAWFRGKYGSM